MPGGFLTHYPFFVWTGHFALAVVAGDYHTCALREDSQVVCWGANINGQLGIETSVDVGTAPGQLGNNLTAVNLGTGKILH